MRKQHTELSGSHFSDSIKGSQDPGVWGVTGATLPGRWENSNL